MIDGSQESLTRNVITKSPRSWSGRRVRREVRKRCTHAHTQAFTLLSDRKSFPCPPCGFWVLVMGRGSVKAHIQSLCVSAWVGVGWWWGWGALFPGLVFSIRAICFFSWACHLDQSGPRPPFCLNRLDSRSLAASWEHMIWLLACNMKPTTDCDVWNNTTSC